MIVMVKCASHLARARLMSAMGRKLQSYWAFNHPSVYGWFGVTADELSKARGVKGVSAPRVDPEEFILTW